jgi:hypothetical protein
METKMNEVIYKTKDRIAYVTLNRPDALNALDDELNDQLWEVWANFSANDAVDVAIVTGAGTSFCSGADLKTFIPKREHATMLDECVGWAVALRRKTMCFTGELNVRYLTPIPVGREVLIEGKCSDDATEGKKHLPDAAKAAGTFSREARTAGASAGKVRCRQPVGRVEREMRT